MKGLIKLVKKPSIKQHELIEYKQYELNEMDKKLEKSYASMSLICTEVVKIRDVKKV